MKYLILLFHVFSSNFVFTNSQCLTKLDQLDLAQEQYNGSWFRIAHMGPAIDYLPQNLNTSLIKLIPEDDHIKMIEFYESNGICYGPLYGLWIKQVTGYIMQIKANDGTLFENDNEEMNIVLYGCRTFKPNGECLQGEETASILSNSRHPQTLALFKSAKHLEDNACIDILRLRTLNTYGPCGDDIVDIDQKLENAAIDTEGELIENECKARNFPRRKIGNFFHEPRMLTVIAFMDPILANEDLSHISCLFSTKNDAICEYIRHKTCYKSTLKQVFPDEFSIESSIELQLNNDSIIRIDWSGTLLWQNGDEYITYKCIDVNEDGTCDQYRIYVWSDEDLMDQPTIHTIYEELDTICVDPTDLIFLNTFPIDECDENTFIKEPSIKCGKMAPWSPINVQLLQGVWFFAADINADPKIYMQSAVVELKADETNHSNETLTIKFFAQRESDLICIGPGSGKVQLIESNSTINVQVEYQYGSLQEFPNSIIQWQNQVLYLDNQRMLLYWCFKRNENGSCLQYDVDILVRSRHLAYHDLSLLEPYLNAACVNQDQLRWFDLHSLCGVDISQTTRLRRMIMTLTHREIEKVGKWFLMSHYDRFQYITYALIGRLTVVERGKAIIKVYQSAARPGLAKECFRRMFVLFEEEDGDDFTYHLYFNSLLGPKSYMILRFLFLNRHVGVVHACMAYNKTGECIKRFLYVLSRHDSIDHTELMVLERIANSVCLPVEHLTHVSVHDRCIYDNYNIKLGTLICSSITNLVVPLIQGSEYKIKERFKNNTFFAIASSIPNQSKFGKCTESDVAIKLSVDTEMLVIVNGSELVLLSPFGLASPLIIQTAQYSGEYPCLNPINYEQQNIEGECMRNDTIELLLKEDGVYSLIPGDEELSYHNGEVGMNGSIAFLNDKFVVLYTGFKKGQLTIPEERRVTVWTRTGIKTDDDVRAVLKKICILEDDLDNKTGTSECWQ
ncbi:unnamed protein product [Dracunculus medinensis]|uniref:Lipocalin-like domain-containing protein n=1 Tax=Dracunculus medinensis TaxID=318479 RepID=A0A158Q333_DRAME|nr:unnamed protein product [Dracunculus medinensis]